MNLLIGIIFIAFGIGGFYLALKKPKMHNDDDVKHLKFMMLLASCTIIGIALIFEYFS